MAPSPTIRRLLTETAELSSPSSNPNPAFFAAPVSDSDLHEWHFTLLGPPAPSPYAGGIYHGRITLPATYPLKPPNFRFLTPSGRFEVNREICLSISGFHEETWMPAWGVRTALTALRSFMAEKGSAGQVGGLESSAEVRMRLAQESRSWRCDACQKSNEAIMREWWEICRKPGVRVLEEEDLGLESLPEGMTLEPRDPSAQTQRISTTSEGGGVERHLNVSEKTAQLESTHTQQQRSDTTMISSTTTPPSTSTPSRQSSPWTESSRSDGASQPQSPSQPHSHDSSSSLDPASSSLTPTSLPFVPTPSAEAVQASAEAVLTPSDLALPPPSSSSSSSFSDPSRPRPRHNPIMSNTMHAPTSSIAAAAAVSVSSRNAQPVPLLPGARDRNPPNPNRNHNREQTITIDRAIAAVFLALCLMVLKKIFYPAGGAGAGTGYGGGGGVGGGVDDIYLQRE